MYLSVRIFKTNIYLPEMLILKGFTSLKWSKEIYLKMFWVEVQCNGNT